MGKRFVQCLALVAFAALVTMTWVSGAGAVTPVAACGILGTAGETYNLTGPIGTCVGACLTVAANNITINLKGFDISSFCGGTEGITDAGVARLNTTINGAPPPGPPAENGSVEGFSGAGINMGTSSRTTVRNIEVSDNGGTGIWLGPNSTIKACEVENNGGHGIAIGDNGTVQNCAVGAVTDIDDFGNGLNGISGGDHMVITGNTVVDNSVHGISVGADSTVSYNDVTLNGFNGILAGPHCVVTGNTSNFNGEEGIATAGFCVVTYNTANNNADDGIDVGWDGTFDASGSQVYHNTTNNNGDDGLHVQCPGSPKTTVSANSSSGNGVNYNPGLVGGVVGTCLGGGNS